MTIADGTWGLLHEDGALSLRRAETPPGTPADEPEERAPAERDELLRALLAAPDPVLRDRLVALGRGFSWHAAGDGETAALIDTLRDDLARLRVFGSLLASPLLPESAANVARQLEPLLADGGEVLAHEGQALIGLALARRGHPVTLWTRDAALAAFVGTLPSLPLDVHPASALTPLPDALRGRFTLALCDTLFDAEGLALLLSRARHALAAEGRVVALGHPMQRGRLLKTAAAAGLALERPLDEIAVRLLCGFAPAEFVWDERVLAPSGEPQVLADATLTAAGGRDLDPTERKHGCVEVLSLAPEGITTERVDRAVALFARGEARAKVTSEGFDDDGVQHVRHLALGGGGHAALTVQTAEGRAAVDVFPWSPAVLARLCAALLTELPRAGEEVPLGR